MANKRRLPSDKFLKSLVDQGHTHQQIADMYNVGRSTVSVALHRMGETEKIRYEEVIPWKVRAVHNSHHALNMLRTKGRMNRGLPVTDEQARRLYTWELRMEALGIELAYDRDRPEGFYYVRVKELVAS